MRCVSCMKEIGDSAVCGFCGFQQNTPQKHPDALPVGTQLRNRFIIGRELGRGGFGITYAAYDQYLDCRVAVKEYLPQTLAGRMPGCARIMWHNIQIRDNGCRNVIREARKMHRLGVLPAAVRVEDVFYENNTAYIAMDYIEGTTLKEYLLKNGVMTPTECLEMMNPVMETMIHMHKEGIIHRDISPDNIMVQNDRKPRLLDFGAAKDTQNQSGDTMLVARNGFSPREQYQTDGSIGTWTDVYALCATMYFCLTGRVPPSSLDRKEGDEIPFPQDGRLPEKLCEIIRQGMTLYPEDRIRDIEDLSRQLNETLNPALAAPVPAVTVPEKLVNPPVQDGRQPEGIPASRGYSEMLQPHPYVPQNWQAEGPKQEPVQPRYDAPGWGGGQNRYDGVPQQQTQPRYDNVSQHQEVSRYEPNRETKGKSWGFLSRLFDRKKKEPALLDPVKVLNRQPRSPVLVRVRNAELYPDLRIEAADEEETVLADEVGTSAGEGILLVERTGERVPITKCCFTVGRMIHSQSMQHADVQLEDETKHMSRLHAALIFDGRSFFLQDISGKNSTFLNGVRLENCTLPPQRDVFQMAYALFDGDKIGLAEETLIFHIGERT